MQEDLSGLIDSLAERVATAIAARLSPTPEPSPWLNVPEAAVYTKLSEEGIRAAEKRGKLRAHRSETGRVRFHRSDLDSFMRGNV